MPIETWFFLIVVAVSFVLSLTILVSTLRTGSPPMPSGSGVRKEALRILSGETVPDGVIYELGSGWGGLARALAVQYPERKVVGVESSLLPYLFSRLARTAAGPANLSFVHKDAQRVVLADAGLVLCYLSGDTLSRIAPALEGELPSQASIMSITFAWPGRNPTVTSRVRDLFRSPIYLYRGAGTVAA